MMISLLPYELAIITVVGIYLLVRYVKDGKEGKEDKADSSK